jgi:hypothetical protein
MDVNIAFACSVAMMRQQMKSHDSGYRGERPDLSRVARKKKIKALARNQNHK